MAVTAVTLMFLLFVQRASAQGLTCEDAKHIDCFICTTMVRMPDFAPTTDVALTLLLHDVASISSIVAA